MNQWFATINNVIIALLRKDVEKVLRLAVTRETLAILLENRWKMAIIYEIGVSAANHYKKQYFGSYSLGGES